MIERMLALCLLYCSVAHAHGLIDIKRESKNDRNLSASKQIDDIMLTIQNTCMLKPHHTIKDVKKNTKKILNSIKSYKDIIQLVKQLQDELKAVIGASRGSTKASIISTLIKRDVKGICNIHRKYKDCTEIHKKEPKRNSGVYIIYPEKNKPGVKAFCDMETDSGGWTVFQKRFNGAVNFNRNWKECEDGFGDVIGEYWLGNKYTNQMTSTGRYELRIDMTDTSGNRKYAVYKTFYIGNAAEKYKLTVGGYSGNAHGGDMMKHHNNMKFSTYDQDNDTWSKHCAARDKAPWWYYACMAAQLNLPFQRKMLWNGQFNIVQSVMMIRHL